MQFVVDIKPEELDCFVESHPFSHYMKTSFWGMYKKRAEGYDVTYAGIVKNGHLAATTLILKKREWFSKKPYLYIPTGMCVDYNDFALLDFFIESLKRYAADEGACFLRIDPNVQRCHRDIMGNRIPDGFSNEAITELLINAGFRHKGYGYAYNGSWINRYTLMIDLSPSIEEIVKKFNRSRQNALKRAEVSGVTTRPGRPDDLCYLVDFEWELTKTQGFKPHDVAYFKELCNTLQKHACLYVTQVDLTHNIDSLNREIESGKYRKDPEALASKQNELANAHALRKKHGDRVVIAIGLFVRFGKKSWDLYTYNRKDFNKFNATDNLHLFAIRDMKKHKVELYDMVGFSGVTDKSDPYFGLYDYKRSFGSHFVEHIGEFDYVLDMKDYKRFINCLRQIKRIRRKWFALRYKKDRA